MGWGFRKSLSIGPFRVNLSKSGVGYSVGGRGFRAGINSQGRRYSSVSIPGTGMSYRRSGSRPSAGCLVILVAAVASLWTGIAWGQALVRRLDLWN